MPVIAISGASGLVGTALQAHLAKHMPTVRVLRFVRDHNKRGDVIYWSPTEGTLDVEALQGVDAIVHLAGEPIGPARWTEQRKQRIHDSRVLGTQLIAEAIAKHSPRPKVLVQASAVGFYGDTGDRVVDEQSPRGTGFLADVCESWEAASIPAERVGVRVVRLRFGHVLQQGDGLLGALRTPTLLGAGRMGDGNQFWSWIHIDDLVALIMKAIEEPAYRGVINAVTPNPVRNKDFVKAFGATLNRSLLVPTPAFALKLAFGPEQAREMLLSGQRVRPKKLEEIGFDFAYPQLQAALA